MNNNAYYTRALELKDEIIANRRTFHGYAELGFDLPKTVAKVMEDLRSYGYEPQLCGKAGVTCTVGNGGKVLLLRGDMDALPMYEESGLPFASTGKSCHSCGHDAHTAMLLGAAKMLKENEANLKGTVKFMFQPAEELLGGALDMIENGILENPRVDAGFGMHIRVATDISRVGTVAYSRGPANFSGDMIRITCIGKDCHGSRPDLGIDAINIAAHIVIALQEVLAREIPCTENSVLLVGKIEGGTSCNTQAGKCVLEVSVRTTDQVKRTFLKNRVKEIAEGTALTFRGKAEVEFVYGIAPMVNNEDMSDEIGSYCREFLGEENVYVVPTSNGTEDFSAVAERIPTTYLSLGCGSIADGYTYGGHNPHMKLDEEAFPIGAALYAYAATRYLENHAE